MAKSRLKRVSVGSVYKPKNDEETGKPKDGSVPYIKMRESGKIFRLESAKFQLESLEKAVAAGRLSSDIADKVRERIEKIPSYVLFEMVELVEQD